LERYGGRGHGGAETQGAGGSLINAGRAGRGRRLLGLLALFRSNRLKRVISDRKLVWGVVEGKLKKNLLNW